MDCIYCSGYDHTDCFLTLVIVYLFILWTVYLRYHPCCPLGNFPNVEYCCIFLNCLVFLLFSFYFVLDSDCQAMSGFLILCILNFQFFNKIRLKVKSHSGWQGALRGRGKWVLRNMLHPKYGYNMFLLAFKTKV